MEITEAFLEEALDNLKFEILSSLHVAVPGIVTEYDPSTYTATVQPALKRKVSSSSQQTPQSESASTTLDAPVLRDVPVYLPDPERLITPGEHCFLLFADFCIDAWMNSGEAALPPASRSHDLSDAVAFVGFHPNPA